MTPLLEYAACVRKVSTRATVDGQRTQVRVLGRGRLCLVAADGTEHRTRGRARLLGGASDTAAIVRALRRRFDAPAGEIEDGVGALLAQLTALHALAGVPPTHPHVAHYDLLGYCARVETDSADYLSVLDRLNAEFRVPPPAPDGDGAPVAFYEALSHNGGKLWELTFQGEELGWHDTLYKAVTAVEFHLCETAIERRQDLIHVHSAALATPTGSLLLPGKSGIGKTTFALALALSGRPRGHRLLSDDVVFVHPQTLQPECFPRQFHVHEDALPRLTPLGLRYAPEDHIGAHLCSTVLGPWDRSPGPPVRWIVFARLAPEEPFSVEEISKAEAAVELMRFSKNLRRGARGGLDVVPRLVDEAACYRMTRNDDLAAAAAALIGLTAGP